MSNFAALLTDVPAEVGAVETLVKNPSLVTFVTGLDKLITDAKANGLSTIVIADVEALIPAPGAVTTLEAEGEAVIADGEKIATDL